MKTKGFKGIISRFFDIVKTEINASYGEYELNEVWSNIENDQTAYLESLKGWSQPEVSESLLNLFETIQVQYLRHLQLDEAKQNILKTNFNINLINKFDNNWQTFKKYSCSAVFKNLCIDLLKHGYGPDFYGNNFDNYDPLKICNNALENILKVMSMKLDQQGTLQYVANGYIERFVKSEGVKRKIIEMIIEGVGVNLSYTDLKKRVSHILASENQVSEELEEYLDTYAYDLFSGIQRAIDLNLADTYGLNCFVYEGDLIKDSREFCRKHLGKIITREEANELESRDWHGKNPDVPFLISLGGYNCRHIAMWIPDEAKESLSD